MNQRFAINQLFRFRRFSMVWCLFLLAGNGLIAQEYNRVEPQPSFPFRLDTDVYTDLKQPPFHHSLTIFSDGVYYDFEEPMGSDSSSEKITMIDPTRSRILLLDRVRQIKLVLSTDDIRTTIANARVQTDAKFATVQRKTWEDSQSQDKSTRTLTVASEVIEYQVTTKASPHPYMIRQYIEFANWSARLNSLHSYFPPYVRIELNEAIASENLLPDKLVRVLRKENRKDAIASKLISTHRFLDRISDEDRARVARVGQMITEFKEVSSQQFFAKSDIPQVAKKSP
jgi:hypothetical protein